MCINKIFFNNKKIIKIIFMFIPILGVVFITGCQSTAPKKISLEDAKRITASYVGKKIEQPARNIDNFLNKLRKNKSGVPEEEAKLKLISYTEPSIEVEKSPYKFMRFLYTRMIARKHIGDHVGAWEDSKKLTPLVRRYNQSVLSKSEMIFEVAYVELMAGDFGVAWQLAKEAFSFDQKTDKAYTQYARFLIFQGQLEEAEEILRQLMSRRKGRDDDYQVPRLRAHIFCRRKVITLNQKNGFELPLIVYRESQVIGRTIRP